MSGSGKVVAVTGGSGYIACWLVKLLLDRGYTVKASVRNLNDSTKTEPLLSLDGGKERLHLFQADLLEEGSFDTLVDGCDGVFHTASPVAFTASNPQVELIEPAVKGTLNVLRSCLRARSIKRVIVTSSMAAVVNYREVKDGVVVDESCFSDPSYCEEGKLWYVLSKTLAEDAAWKFAKEHGIDMVAINPGYVIGPLLQRSLSLTPGFLLDLVTGAESFSNSVCRFVDVRDVATAHILAFEVPSASGRYCVVGRSAYWSEAINILRKLYPTLPLPDKCHDDPLQTCLKATSVSKKKAAGLGIQFYPLEVTLKDSVDSLVEMNLLNLGH